MSTLVELARQHTLLTRDEVVHLQQLTSEWGMLADLCFADLLLYAPTADARWIVVAHVRPATAQTIYLADWVGSWANDSERPLLDASLQRGETTAGSIDVESMDEPCRMVAMPVRREGRVVAMMTREFAVRGQRQPGVLERTYMGLFEQFARMVSEGRFPFPGPVADSSAAPRVGDGVLVLDEEAFVRYASPNAVSALHRVGISTNAVGHTLAELGFHDGPVRQAFERRVPVVEEFDQTPEVTILGRCLPTVDADEVTGGVLLLRDVTELRRRDRLILSKDATIREIHHRVKNNLQTISSLLRLQSRRLHSEEAKAAVSESVRRIRTIALVHETLSREPGDDVAFIEIVRPLMRLAEEGLQSPDNPVSFSVQGDGGRLPSNVATPLSVVLTELLQNAVDHGFPATSPGADRRRGHVVVRLANDGVNLHILVVDDGRGLEQDFELARATGLGLSIVRTLVSTELNGTITMRTGEASDFDDADPAMPCDARGTVVDLTVPLAAR